MKKQRTADFITLFALAVIAVLASLLFHANFLGSTLLFFGLPSAYLLSRGNIKWKELIAALILFGFIAGTIGEYFAERMGVWVIHGPLFPIGPFSLDAGLWSTLQILLLVLYYERFVDHDRKDRVSKHVWTGYTLLALLLLIAGAVMTFSPGGTHIAYGYLLIGLLLDLPFAYVLWLKPQLAPKLLMTLVYFFPLQLAYELTARSLNQWSFPGSYIGIVTLGGVSFPFEEFLFWILGGSVIMLAAYEYFVDDMK